MEGPEQVSRRLVAHLNAGEIDSVVALYEENAFFADLGGAVRGLEDIRSAHCNFAASGNVLELNTSAVFVAGDIALVHWSWTVTRPDGSTIEGVSAEVLRRQRDGQWKYVIDNSDGSAMVGLTTE
jgi:ketosteroid isomerase-like protein